MGKIDLKRIGRVMDVSAVRTDVDFQEINQMIEIVKKYHCICASPMPWATGYTVEQLAGMDDIVVTGVVGFPSGADTTFIKMATAKEMLSMGCKELDMVINVSALKAGKCQVVEDDIRAVVEAAGHIPVKTIIEICYLSDDEIRRASELAVKAGAAFVKTGTGWGPRPTTIETIRLIRETIGDAAKIKAAGGIRDLDTMLEMAEAGCDRFGIGVRSAVTIIEEAERRGREKEARSPMGAGVVFGAN